MTPPLPVILAAGAARRFGGGKLDADCAGRPLGAWTVSAVAEAGLDPGLIVHGETPPAFARDAASVGWRLLRNSHAEDGIGTSIALAAHRAAAWPLLFLLADMPLVDGALIGRLIAASRDGGAAATRHADGRPGVPAVLPASLRRRLVGLTGDRGAGPILAAMPHLRTVAADPVALLDVDDGAALATAAARLTYRSDARP